MTFAELHLQILNSAFSPVAKQRMLDALDADVATAQRERAATAAPDATAARALELAHAQARKVDRYEAQQRAHATAARAQRERQICAKQRELREGGHVHHDRAAAIHVLDNEARWAAQTAAHQARMAAAAQPAPAAPAQAKPALRIVPRAYDVTQDLSPLLASEFGRRV